MVIRWENSLKPGIKRSDWTAQEDAILFAVHEQYGGQWRYFTKILPGRTDHMIKHRWSHLSKQVQTVILT